MLLQYFGFCLLSSIDIISTNIAMINHTASTNRPEISAFPNLGIGRTRVSKIRKPIKDRGSLSLINQDRAVIIPTKAKAAEKINEL